MRPSKRDEIIDKALAIFERDGYQATGMDGLAKACGVSKTTFYNHFRTKEALILAALSRRDEAFRAGFEARAETTAPEDRLLAVFDELKAWFASAAFTGCSFIKAAAEHQGSRNPVRALSVAHKKALLEDLRGWATAAGVAGAWTLAHQVQMLIDGAIISAQLGLSPDPAGDAKKAAAALIAASRH